MTNIKCEKSDSVRKVRLKTASGFLNLCYRSSQSQSHETDHNSSERSSVKTTSQEGSQVSVVTDEPSFGSLPELFDFQAQFSIINRPECEGRSSSLVDLPPDFSTYNFWASESRSDSGISLSNAIIGLSDTFSRCDYAEIPLHYPSEVLDSTVEEVKGPPDHKLLLSATKSNLPQSQNSINTSYIEEETTNRKRCWDLPILELEEDIFECNWNLLKEFTDDERDSEREMSIVDSFLVERSPPQPHNVESNVENLASDNLLVYAPNRYLDKDASYFFQSCPADVEIDKSDVNSRTIDDERIQALHKVSSYKKWSGVREKNHTKEGEPSTDVECWNSHTASWIEVCSKEIRDVITAKKAPSKSETGHTPRMQNFNHRRRRFSAPGLKRSKFLKPSTTLTSLDGQRSPNPTNREKVTPAGQRSPRGMYTPTRKADTTVRRLLKSGYFSDSPPSGRESDHECHKTPRRTTPCTTPPRQSSMPSGDEKKRVRRRADISLRESYAASSPLKVTTNLSSKAGGIPTTLSLSLNLPTKKRTRYTSIRHDGPDDTSKTETKLDVSQEYHVHAHSPKNSQMFTGSTTPPGSPAIAQLRRSPWDGNRKKVRTFRRRAPQSSPTPSAKTLQFYSKVIHRDGASDHDVQQGTISPDLDVFSVGTKLAEKRGRRRLPLPQSSVDILQGWLRENEPNPYPSRQEKAELQFQTGLKLSQVDNWLGNARQKLKLKSRAVKDLRESSSSPELKKRSKRKRSYPLKMKI